jgi:hypothetical protein
MRNPKMYAIIVRELSGNETELCRVGTNPKAIAKAARRKYSKVTIREIHTPEKAHAQLQSRQPIARAD